MLAAIVIVVLVVAQVELPQLLLMFVWACFVAADSDSSFFCMLFRFFGQLQALPASEKSWYYSCISLWGRREIFPASQISLLLKLARLEEPANPKALRDEAKLTARAALTQTQHESSTAHVGPFNPPVQTLCKFEALKLLLNMPPSACSYAYAINHAEMSKLKTIQASSMGEEDLEGSSSPCLLRCWGRLDRSSRLSGQEFLLLQSSLCDLGGALQELDEELAGLGQTFQQLKVEEAEAAKRLAKRSSILFEEERQRRSVNAKK
eukprot:GHVT01006315.1.p1 GENE.GHVT01006315.1~~GHVT01006315.1.p1  ORF type:complete len:264 (+),score=47.41 GHVT01006315.1:1224-2015(+)